MGSPSPQTPISSQASGLRSACLPWFPGPSPSRGLPQDPQTPQHQGQVRRPLGPSTPWPSQGRQAGGWREPGVLGGTHSQSASHQPLRPLTAPLTRNLFSSFMERERYPCCSPWQAERGGGSCELHGHLSLLSPLCPSCSGGGINSGPRPPSPQKLMEPGGRGDCARK